MRPSAATMLSRCAPPICRRRGDVRAERRSRTSGLRATPLSTPTLYDLENQAVDPDGILLDAMRDIAPWAGRSILDLGCGTGYWLDVYAGEAAEVIGVEPDPDLCDRARSRHPDARVLAGSAEHLPLPDSTVEVVHARFAYFFPPGCDAGLAEVLRVLTPGGRLVVVDNDQRHGDFATLLAASAFAAARGRAERPTRTTPRRADRSLRTARLAATRQHFSTPCMLIRMANVGDLRVSSRGQMSLPALPRHRWGLDAGGEVGFLDLGDALVIVPGGVSALRGSLLAQLDDTDWSAAREGFGDPDLASE